MDMLVINEGSLISDESVAFIGSATILLFCTLFNLLVVSFDIKNERRYKLKMSKKEKSEREKFKLVMLEDMNLLNSEEEKRYEEIIGDIDKGNFDSFDTYHSRDKYYKKFIYIMRRNKIWK